MRSDRQLTFTDYWVIVRRYWRRLILAFVITSIGTVVLILILPNIYRASTSVLVEAPKVPEAYVQSTVATRVQERLRTITQQITSRTRLEQVARELQLISNSLEGKDLDDYMTKMSKSIGVKVQGIGNDIFIVSYEGHDPRTVMLVANKLVSQFIQDNLKMREQYAKGATEFLESELQRVGQLLQTQEKTVAEYKQRSIGELPAQQDSNQRALDRLQQQLQSIVTTLESVRARRSGILRQFAQQETAPTLSPTDATHPSSSGPSSLEQQLMQRRLALASLQRIYMDKHPDIIRLQREITGLEAQIAAQGSESQATESVQSVDIAAKSISRQRQKDIEQIDLEENKLRQQQATAQEQITAYEKKVANASRREQELLVLTRDYENTRKNYDSIAARLQQAQIAENLEKRQKTEQFRVLDEARIPIKPWKPRRIRILLAGMALGLAVGGGAVFLAAYLDQAFHDPEAIEHCTALPVLGTIPLLMTAVDKRKRRLKRLCFLAACLLTPPATVTAVHFYWMRLDILFPRTLTFLNF